MGVTASVIAIGATIFSVEKQAKATREAKRGRKAQKRLNEIAAARARRKASAAARRARAETVSEAAAAGVVGTSAVSGALSSIQAQAAERVGFSKVQTQIGEEISGFAAGAARAETAATTAGAVAGLPSQLGLQPSFASVFDKAPTTTTAPPPATPKKD